MMRAARRGRANRRPVAIVAAAVLAVGGIVGVARGGLSGSAPHARPSARASDTTSSGTVATSRVDRRRGLLFEVETSTAFSDSALYVKMTRDAPRSTSVALVNHPLVGTCDVPGQRVREFAGR